MVPITHCCPGYPHLGDCSLCFFFFAGFGPVWNDHAPWSVLVISHAPKPCLVIQDRSGSYIPRNSSHPKEQLSNVQMVQANSNAFAALRRDGRVVTGQVTGRSVFVPCIGIQRHCFTNVLQRLQSNWQPRSHGAVPCMAETAGLFRGSCRT